jgi:hypothetical protein
LRRPDFAAVQVRGGGWAFGMPGAEGVRTMTASVARVCARIITPALSLTPGTRLGPYEILTPIGAGYMGEVYRANDTRSIAITDVSPHTSLDVSVVSVADGSLKALLHSPVLEMRGQFFPNGKSMAYPSADPGESPAETFTRAYPDASALRPVSSGAASCRPGRTTAVSWSVSALPAR